MWSVCRRFAFRQIVTVLLWLLPGFLSKELTFASAQCAIFQFPEASFDTETMIVPKGNQLTIRFVLNNDSCGGGVHNPKDFTITVAKTSPSSRPGINIDVCKFTHTNGSCTGFRLDCKCPDEQGRYTLFKTWEAGDETDWLWKTPGYAQEKRFPIQQRYAPNITSLSVQPSVDPTRTVAVFQAGESVDILCAYEEGKPSVEPVLWKADTRQLTWTDRHSKGKRRHRIDNLQCDHSETYWCKAAGVSGASNQSVALLVECAPLYVKHSLKKEGHVWQFLFKSFTDSITNCSLTKHEAAGADVVHDCLSHSTVEGTPPLILLSVKTNVLGRTASEEGNWTLTVANSQGPVTFTFSVPGLDGGTGSLTTEEDLNKFIKKSEEAGEGGSGSNNGATASAVAGSCSSVVLVVLAALNVCCVRPAGY